MFMQTDHRLLSDGNTPYDPLGQVTGELRTKLNTADQIMDGHPWISDPNNNF